MMPTIAQEPIQNHDLVTAADELLKPLVPQEWPSVDHLVTEDDTPVDNFPSAKQQRLLVESLYNTWTPREGARPNWGVAYYVSMSYVV